MQTTVHLKHLMTTSALVVSLAALPVIAQETSDSASETQSDESQSAQSGGDDAMTSGTNGSEMGEDMLLVTVGDADISSSDVTAAISALPPQLRQQPPEMLVPMAVNQLIARELMLKAAIAEELADDPEVLALVAEAQNASKQEAMVRVWLQRKLSERVTDERVESKYEEIKADSEQEIPPLDAVRAQIEQQLRQDAFTGIQEELRQDVEIVYYGPDGKPQTASAD